MNNRNMRALAEVRLVALTQEGIGEVAGVSNVDGKDTVFIRINHDINESDPSYHAKIGIIRARLKHLLGDLDFIILGHYDEPEDGQHDPHYNAQTRQGASAKPPHPKPPAHADDRDKKGRVNDLLRRDEFERNELSGAVALLESQVYERLIQLERKAARLPSKGFIVVATLLNLLLVALMLVFQTRLLSLLNELISVLQNSLQSFIGPY